MKQGEKQKCRLAKKGVHSQDFGDEVVVVNLYTGKYFSFRQGAAQVWLLFQKQEVWDLGHLFSCFGKTEEDTELTQFLDMLFEEGLVEKEVMPIEGNDPLPLDFDPVLQPLLVEVYDDMKELLLLDPIHDVDAKVGWPVQK